MRLMTLRDQFLHEIALVTRQSREQKLKKSSALLKAELDAERAQRTYLQAQAKVSTVSAENRKNLQDIRYYPEKEAAKIRREAERNATTSEKEKQKCYTELRIAEIDLTNAKLDEQIKQLENLLNVTLSIDDYFNINSLKLALKIPEFVKPNVGMLPLKPDPQTFKPEKPTGIKKLIPGSQAKYNQELALARELYKQAVEKYEQRIKSINDTIRYAKQAYEQKVSKLQQEVEIRNSLVNKFEEEFSRGDPHAIVDYFMLVLEASIYPDNFPQHAKLAYISESKQLVIEYDLPPFSVVPEIGSYKYTKTKDEVSTTNRSSAQRKTLYSSIIAQITIRSLHELFEADRTNHLETIIFNGYVDAIDRGTGRKLRECLVTTRVTRDLFLSFDLGKVDPIACLKVMNASVSKTPEDLAPVKPVLEFSMVDPRFIEETDVLSSLDQRPNLMDLKPTEFESLIANLFEKMGLETRQTQASRDGGVDCVAYDARPILGGKVVIQAKRYKHTVGVSAVRDLYGTLQNEGASKGILVTTSGYGKAAFDFAAGKPIELLSGSNLLYLLETHAGIQAKIEAPNDWKDPIADTSAEE